MSGKRRCTAGVDAAGQLNEQSAADDHRRSHDAGPHLSEEGRVVPRHQHENEQITYVLEGALRFRLGVDGAQQVDVCDRARC